MFFETVSFPSAIWCLPKIPWSWVPNDEFAHGEPQEDTAVDPQSHAESERQREAEKKRRPLATTAPGHPYRHAPCTPAGPFPWNFLLKWEGVSAHRMPGAAREGRRWWSHIRFHPGCLEPGLSLLWPPPPPACSPTDTLRQSKCTSLPWHTCCNSNDKVRTET